MMKQADLSYLWKDIDYDTEDEILGKVYPRTVIYLRWNGRTFHIIETENGEYYCGYPEWHPSGPIYICTKSFIENLIQCICKAEIPEEIKKYYKDEMYQESTRAPFSFWAIECRWKGFHLRFMDDTNVLTSRFAPKARELIEIIEREIEQQTRFYPEEPKKTGF